MTFLEVNSRRFPWLFYPLCAVMMILAVLALASCGGAGGGGDEDDDDDPADVAVSASPGATTIAIGETQQFSATGTGATQTFVNWVVEEATGGSIDTNGLYTAPQSAGTYHVTAISVADNTRTDTATVTVTGGAAAATVVTIGNTVVVPDIKRLGVNLGSDVWYNPAIYTKERIRNGGFEGILYRTMGYGPVGTGDTYMDWWGIGDWSSLIIGADAWFVSGPRKWEPLVIQSQQTAYYAPQDRDLQQYTFTPSGDVPNANDGFLIESDQEDIGFIGQHGGAYWVFTDGGAAVTTEAGDVPAGSEGLIAAVLTAEDDGDMARLLAPLATVDHLDVAGVWDYRLWAKGSGTLSIALGDWSHHGQPEQSGEDLSESISLTDTWQEITGTFIINGFPSEWSTGTLALSIQHTGGTAKVDEISVMKQGDVNPTPFRDDLVNLLKDLNPGSLRHLQIGGSSIENVLKPRNVRKAFSHSRSDQPADGTWPAHPDTNGDADTHPYGLHEFLQLCEQVGTDSR